MSARGRVALAATPVAVLGVRLSFTAGDTPGRAWWPLLVLAGVVVLGGLWVARPGRRAGSRRGRGAGLLTGLLTAGSAGQVARWSARSRRYQGVASWWSILVKTSAWAMRRKAKVLRPSLAGRWWVRAIEVAQPIARVCGLRVWSAIEDVTLRVGGPRSGKSGELACRILDAQGAVIATSTRTDLYSTCAGLRRGRGPVFVFNPSRMGGVPSSVAFDPLTGCTDPTTAGHRAEDLLAGANLGSGSAGDREFWLAQARRALGALLHAAALGKASMRDVAEWVANPKASQRQVLSLLRMSPEPSCAVDAEQFLDTNERTQSSITTTVMPALAWLADAGAWEATQPTLDGERVGLDVAALIAGRGTVFLIGAEEAHSAPLVTALTGYIAREARLLAAECPSGRLDPGLEFVLDEAALICRIPLDRWSADMGGRNIALHIGAQSFSQLVGKFGQASAEAIIGNAATVMVFGGTRSPSDLSMYSTLSGERHEVRASWGQDGRLSYHTQTVPVLTAAQISQLPARRVLIIKRELRPMIGRVQMAWKRPDVRAYRRALRWQRRAEATLAFAVEARRAAIVWTATFRAWARPRWARLCRLVELWARRLSETQRQRTERRRVEAAQARARKRGL